ncbi:MAG TPA: bifunctional pyr operon transcriptional regulator/uracil phosphoribosyltransferase PyrR [Vicinamibacteria bacterium]
MAGSAKGAAAAAPPGFRVRRELLDAERLSRALARIAHQIVERPRDAEGLVLVGVRTRGVPLARRLARLVAEAGAPPPPVGALDITLYRDDLTTVAPQPVLRRTEIPGSIDGRTVVLVDDVLFTGRTVRAALDEIIDFGRPARIKLAVLVDRGHRELPICPDYVGQTITTARDESVQVLLQEDDGVDRVLLLEKAPAARPRRPVKKRKQGRRA